MISSLILQIKNNKYIKLVFEYSYLITINITAFKNTEVYSQNIFKTIYIKNEKKKIGNIITPQEYNLLFIS